MIGAPWLHLQGAHVPIYIIFGVWYGGMGAHIPVLLQKMIYVHFLYAQEKKSLSQNEDPNSVSSVLQK